MMNFRCALRNFLLLLMFAAVAFQASAHAEKAGGIHEMPAGRYRLDRDHAHIYWAVSHVGFSMTRGRFDDFDGEVQFDPADLAKSSARFLIQSASINANNEKLEQELLGEDFFDSANHPRIEFVFKSAQLSDERNGVIVGDLSMKGVTKPVSLEFRLNKTLPSPKNPKFTRMGFSGRGVIDRRDWDVDGVDMVGAEVEIMIDAEFLLDVEGNSDN